MGIDETGSSNIGAIWAVRQGQQNRRGRGRNNNNRKNHNPLARSFESNGPDVKIRGTPAHIAEKYLTLARDAQSSGDPVLAENYLQHAEHYTRIIMAYREQLQQPGDVANGNGQRMREPGRWRRRIRRRRWGRGARRRLSAADAAPAPAATAPARRLRGGNRHEGAGRHDRPFRRDQGRFRDRDRNQDRNQDRDQDRQGENRPPTPERQQEPAEAAGGEQQRRRERFPQQAHEQPEFLRRPVRRARSEGEENAAPGKEEPPRD